MKIKQIHTDLQSFMIEFHDGTIYLVDGGELKFTYGDCRDFSDLEMLDLEYVVTPEMHNRVRWTIVSITTAIDTYYMNFRTVGANRVRVTELVVPEEIDDDCFFCFGKVLKEKEVLYGN